MTVIDIVSASALPWDFDYRPYFVRRLRDVNWIRFVCGYLSIAVSLSLSSSFVLMFNEANILLWQIVVTLIWSTMATIRCPYGVRQLTRAIVQTIVVRGTVHVMIVMIVVKP